MTDLNQPYQQYQIVEKAINFIKQHVDEQPSLAEIAQAVDLSEFHLQRVFTAWAGISPKKFLQYLTKEQALANLQSSKNILTAAWDSGLSGTGRLHDLMIMAVAMTPGEIKALGKDVLIEYGFIECRFGLALIAWTARGICHLAFNEDKEVALAELVDLWPRATLNLNTEQAVTYGRSIFEPSAEKREIKLVLKGTNFQLKVLEALIKAPIASVVSYSDLALAIGQPKAQRAVGSAVARNTLAYLIPCHRVIRESGEFGNYRWGIDKKAALLAWETAQASIETGVPL